MTASTTLRGGLGLALVAIVGWFVADFPILRFPLAIGFAAYSVGLWRWPQLWLIVLPASLPIFDLAPWSGRFFFDEFDALVLLTAGVLALTDRGEALVPRVPPAVKWVLALLTASYVISTMVWLWPPPAITPNSFANYYSPYNSLRIAKGFVWALLLLRPLRQAIATDPNAKFLLCFGFLIGLAGVDLISVYERWLFPGILTVDTDYRVTASFSSMHTGDGHIDVFLATTIPMLGALLIRRDRVLLLPVTIGLSVLSLYALFAAGSRGPVIAAAIGVTIGCSALLLTRVRRSFVIGAVVSCVAVAGLTVVIAFPLLPQSFFVQRFAQIGPDAAFRLGHWRHALSLRDDSLVTQIFGMGLGSYPLAHQERATEPRATRFRFSSEGKTGYLTLWDGQSMYMGQVIKVKPNTDYTFSVRVRTSEPNAVLTVNLCELWMLASRNCTGIGFRTSPNPGQWQSLSARIHDDQVGTVKTIAGITIRRPTWLTFFTVNSHVHGIDISGLSLKDSEGRELISNGDFARGADRWFWTVDTHLAWHVKNLIVNVLFDQGWFGIVAVGSLLLLTLVLLAHQIASKDPLSAVFLGAMTGFIVNGITVSTFDQPRLALMFYVLCLTIICDSKRSPTFPSKEFANRSRKANLATI